MINNVYIYIFNIVTHTHVKIMYIHATCTLNYIHAI